MAHLVPIPLPTDYWRPQLNSTYVNNSGKCLIGVWGQVGGYGDNRIGTEEDEFNDDLDSQPISLMGLHADVVVYEVRGVRRGHKLMLMQRNGTTWRRFSTNIVDISWNMADVWEWDFLAGKLPRCKHNAKISYYPFGSSQRRPVPVPEDVWMRSIEHQFDIICANPLGQALVKMIDKDVVIHPWIKSYHNANSAVKFSPQDWSDDGPWGSAPHEILLHELIHVLEGNYSGYDDRYGFMFDKSDFLSVNATNVYSCLLGRGLRKDHHEFNKLPDEHFNNPKLHYDQQEPNYDKADSHTPDIVRELQKYRSVWNPFIYC